MNHNELYQLLVRYVDGEATTEEVVVMEELIQNVTYWKHEYDILNQLNQSVKNSLNYTVSGNTENNWEALKLDLAPQKMAYHFWLVFAKYAAAASIFFIAGWLFFILNANKNYFKEFEPGNTYQTKANETKSITLTDGSKVVLNQNSKLTIDANYNLEQRLITMEGEVYFNVSKDASLSSVS